MIYHIFPGNQEHLVLSMLEFFSTRIHPKSENVKYLILFSDQDKMNNYNINNYLGFLDNEKELRNLFSNITRKDIVIFHSLIFGIVWKHLFYYPQIWSRIIWVAWGGDFFFEEFFRPKSIRFKIRNFRKKLICKKIGAICTLVPGDYDLISNVLGCKDKYFRTFYSTHSLANYGYANQWYDLKSNKRPLRVLVGNSAAETNRHLRVFESLSVYCDENLEIICPLSYAEGLQGYRDMVLKRGRELFGEKFQPLTNLLDFEEYKKFLDNVDVLIFNHPRQQGLFNLMYFIFHGKKVFLAKESTTFSMLKSFNMLIHDTQSIGSQSFEEFASMSFENRKSNMALAQRYLSLETAEECWKKLLKQFSCDF